MIFNLLMPGMLVDGLLAGLAILFALFLIFVWKEKARDEREEAVQMKVGRISYMAVSTVLALGIGVEALHGMVDMWLVLALGVAVLAKSFGRYFNNL